MTHEDINEQHACKHQVQDEHTLELKRAFKKNTPRKKHPHRFCNPGRGNCFSHPHPNCRSSKFLPLQATHSERLGLRVERSGGSHRIQGYWLGFGISNWPFKLRRQGKGWQRLEHRESKLKPCITGKTM